MLRTMLLLTVTSLSAWTQAGELCSPIKQSLKQDLSRYAAMLATPTVTPQEEQSLQNLISSTSQHIQDLDCNSRTESIRTEVLGVTPSLETPPQESDRKPPVTYQGTEDPSDFGERFTVLLGLATAPSFALSRIPDEALQLPDFPTIPSDPNRPFETRSLDYFLDDNSGTRSYLEFRFRGRYAWLAANDTANVTDDKVRELFPSFRKAGLFDLLDHDFRLGFTIGEDEKLSSSSVFGTGEFNVSVALGLPVFAWETTFLNQTFVQTINLEALAEYNSDSKLDDVRRREGYGVSYNVGWPAKGLFGGPNPTTRAAEFSFRYLTGVVDTPDTFGSFPIEGEARRLVESADGFPDFDGRSDAGWIDLDINIPILKTGYLMLGGSIITDGAAPAPWVFRAGLTLQIDKIVPIFGSASGDSGEK